MSGVVPMRLAARRPWTVRTYLVACVAAALVLLALLEVVLAQRSLHNATTKNRQRAGFEASLAGASVQDALQQGETALAGVASTLPLAQLLANPDACTLSFSDLGVFPTGHIDVVLPDGRVPCSSLTKHGAPA